MKKALMSRLASVLLLPLLSLMAGSGCAASMQGTVQRGDYHTRDDVKVFVDEMVSKHQFEAQELNRMFAQVKQQQRVLEVIQRPAEAKPWYEYRPIFLTATRINGGVAFWDANVQLLEKAEAAYGVPPEYLVAILGVETYYGKRTGSFPVFDTLTTLGFDYPPRAEFFRRELGQYLLLTREETLDPLALKGSYAGAMGKGQFISSSYRSYAVDFDGDGVRDLWNSTADAVGSVANYFSRHGWRAGETVVVPAKVKGRGYESLLDKGLKPSLTLDQLARQGVRPAAPVAEAQPNVTLIELEGKQANEYWIGLKNFYVITRYNHSALYAMAVHQLAQEIKQQRETELANAGEQ